MSNYAKYECLKVEIVERVAIVTLNRPQKLNAHHEGSDHAEKDADQGEPKVAKAAGPARSKQAVAARAESKGARIVALLRRPTEPRWPSCRRPPAGWRTACGDSCPSPPRSTVCRSSPRRMRVAIGCTASSKDSDPNANGRLLRARVAAFFSFGFSAAAVPDVTSAVARDIRTGGVRQGSGEPPA